VKPKVPTLYSVMSTGTFANNSNIYAVNSNAFILQRNQVVDIVVNNHDAGKHPFHLHGHQFQVIQRAPDNSGDYNTSTAALVPTAPMRRDTMLVYPGSNMVLRFRADNPDK
jgi:iron transport multicopper oxidase